MRHGCWTEDEPIVEMVVHLDAHLLQKRSIAVRPGIWPLAEHGIVEALRDAGVASFDAVGSLCLGLLGRLDAAPSKAIATDAPIVRVLETVGQTLERRWSVGDMAKLVALSEAQFGRRFRLAAGQPPMRWLLDRRLSRAEWLMSTSERSLTEIAMMVGFGSPSRFSEAFTRRHGRSPSQWRASQ